MIENGNREREGSKRDQRGSQSINVRGGGMWEWVKMCAEGAGLGPWRY